MRGATAIVWGFVVCALASAPAARALAEEAPAPVAETSAGGAATGAPPLERVRELEAEAERLRAELAVSTAESERLRQTAGTLAGRDGERAAALERLWRENARLSAGARWPEWLTGAGILAAGMLLGALVRGWTSARRASRIRL